MKTIEKQSRIVWYDKKGKPLTSAHIGSDKWLKEMRKVESLLTDWEYKKVAWNKLWWGGHISTVWLGLDHSFSLQPRRPIIFETMIFKPGGEFGRTSVEMERYATEEEALAGHRRLYRQWSNPIFLLKYFISLLRL